MRFAFLGKTGLRVPELSMGFGTMVGTEEIDQKIGRCMDAGVCLFDTADAYSDGHSEATLGQALVGKRQSVLLSTKASYRVGPGENDLGSSRHHLVNACEASLKRLRTDWIDLYQLHGPDAFTHPDETMRAMDDLVRSGKVRYIGCSNYSGWQLMQAQASARAQHARPFSFQQVHYSLACRDAEFELFPAGEDQNMGAMIWGPLAAGFLSGKYRPDKPLPDGSRLAKLPTLESVPDWDHGFKILEVAEAIAQARNVPVGQVAINWLLRKPWVSTVILGARTLAQLDENLGSAGWRLSREETERLDAVSMPAPLRYPYWVQKLGAPERSPFIAGFRD